MRNFLLLRSALFLVLVASVAVVKERAPESRYVFLSEKSQGRTVARLALGQMQKKPESKPGMAILEFSSAGVYIVNSFR
ncbi:hypothetical protein BON30_42090 [Cystobacter ferrugineus]|uniref:Uncharacterized protein n=1 Tax=Cystobacter ferrugineus TaxID=83449 RepID=A0A1L9AXM8_9BACT|nr:hypothetical protein BON30_42090 [Cystobacter ferrugineus]